MRFRTIECTKQATTANKKSKEYTHTQHTAHTVMNHDEIGGMTPRTGREQRKITKQTIHYRK